MDTLCTIEYFHNRIDYLYTDRTARASSAPGSCIASPDGAGCVGLWTEEDYDKTQPSLTVTRWCPTENPCCGIDCGAHGTLLATDGSGAAGCSCTCHDNYTGDHCELALFKSIFRDSNCQVIQPYPCPHEQGGSLTELSIAAPR